MPVTRTPIFIIAFIIISIILIRKDSRRDRSKDNVWMDFAKRVGGTYTKSFLALREKIVVIQNNFPITLETWSESLGYDHHISVQPTLGRIEFISNYPFELHLEPNKKDPFYLLEVTISHRGGEKIVSGIRQIDERFEVRTSDTKIANQLLQNLAQTPAFFTLHPFTYVDISVKKNRFGRVDPHGTRQIIIGWEMHENEELYGQEALDALTTSLVSIASTMERLNVIEIP